MNISAKDKEFVVRGLTAWQTDWEIICEFSGRPDSVTWANVETLVGLALYRTRDMVRVEKAVGDSSSMSDLARLRQLLGETKGRRQKEQVLKELGAVGDRQKRKLAGLGERVTGTLMPSVTHSPGRAPQPR